MHEFILKHKKTAISLAIVAALVLLGLYLFALLRPGIWYRDTFLYLKDGGSFAGEKVPFKYNLQINKTELGTEILFSVNDLKKSYHVSGEMDDITITQDGEQVFRGRAALFGDTYLLLDENGGLLDPVSISYSTTAYQEPPLEELLPSYSSLYNWSVSVKHDTRGTPAVLLIILILVGFLILDIVFPDLFFILSHGLSVDGGTPSAFYRFGQKLGRIIIICLIVYSVFFSFSAP